MLVLDFKVDYRLKILKGISVQSMECLNEDAKKKKNISCTLGGRDDQIATSAKLLYRFSGDLSKPLSNQDER